MHENRTAVWLWLLDFHKDSPSAVREICRKRCCACFVGSYGQHHKVWPAHRWSVQGLTDIGGKFMDEIYVTLTATDARSSGNEQWSVILRDWRLKPAPLTCNIPVQITAWFMFHSSMFTTHISHASFYWTRNIKLHLNHLDLMVFAKTGSSSISQVYSAKHKINTE